MSLSPITDKDLLNNIYQNISFRDLVYCRSVCKLWHKATETELFKRIEHITKNIQENKFSHHPWNGIVQNQSLNETWRPSVPILTEEQIGATEFNHYIISSVSNLCKIFTQLGAYKELITNTSKVDYVSLASFLKYIDIEIHETWDSLLKKQHSLRNSLSEDIPTLIDFDLTQETYDLVNSVVDCLTKEYFSGYIYLIPNMFFSDCEERALDALVEIPEEPVHGVPAAIPIKFLIISILLQTLCQQERYKEAAQLLQDCSSRMPSIYSIFLKSGPIYEKTIDEVFDSIQNFKAILEKLKSE